jgi:hypothetical protein
VRAAAAAGTAPAGGERKTLRLVAKYADATNLFGGDPEQLAHKLRVLRGHCDAEGRDYDRIEKTTIGYRSDPLTDTDGFLREMEAYAAVGITKVWAGAPTSDPAAWVAEVAERVLPRMRAI